MKQYHIMIKMLNKIKMLNCLRTALHVVGYSSWRDVACLIRSMNVKCTWVYKFVYSCFTYSRSSLLSMFSIHAMGVSLNENYVLHTLHTYYCSVFFFLWCKCFCKKKKNHYLYHGIIDNFLMFCLFYCFFAWKWCHVEAGWFYWIKSSVPNAVFVSSELDSTTQ